MAFRLEDFKKTTRKSSAGSGVPASVYPHQMRDKKALARLEIAIRTFDGLVDKRRGEMDAQAMTDFFGDPRLARGVVACLGQFYQYRTPRFAQIVGSEAEQKLVAAGLSTPMALRAHTFAHVNEAHDGFLTEAQRANCYHELAAPFRMTAHDWDTLLHLDADDNQVLTRPGAVPTPADIAALYNFHALDTPLRRATRIVLTGLALTASDATDVRALARSFGVKAVVSEGGSAVTLSDLEMSSLLPRRAGRLARCLLHLMQAFATKETAGHADAQLGTRTFRLTLGPETWKSLGELRPKTQSVTFRRRFEVAEALHKGLLRLRTQGEAAGWRIQRSPEPIVTAQGVLLADFKLVRDTKPVYVVLGDAPGGTWDAPTIAVPLGKKPLEAADLFARIQDATHNLFTLPTPTAPTVPNDVRALCDRAATQGMVRTADAQRALHLLDESPLIEWVRLAADPRVRYLPGIGLCSLDLVEAIVGNPQA